MRLTPSLVVAMLALFVALGGSALAVHTRTLGSCGNGSVKAFAALNFDSISGAFPQGYTSQRRFFVARYSCTGRAAQLRHSGAGIWDIRFPGIAPRAATVSILSANSHGAASWSVLGDGAFRVYTLDADGTPHDHGFTIAVY
jgi:hypothetical protein